MVRKEEIYALRKNRVIVRKRGIYAVFSQPLRTRKFRISCCAIIAQSCLKSLKIAYNRSNLLKIAFKLEDFLANFAKIAYNRLKSHKISATLGPGVGLQV